MSAFTSILLGKNVMPPPRIGAGRVHSADGGIDDLPSQAERFMAILRLIPEGGERSTYSLQQNLSYRVGKELLIRDCSDLVEIGILEVSFRSDTNLRYRKKVKQQN